MVAARDYNEREGAGLSAVYGCVTTGEAWQFLRLVAADVTIDLGRLYIDNVGGILAVFGAIVSQTRGPA
jgi:hypothetical protein